MDIQCLKMDSIIADFLNSKIFDTKTELCQIMLDSGTDKSNGWHNYTPFYDLLFQKYINTEIKLFELGLGSINPNVPSNMGYKGVPCASLRGWRKYFGKNSLIYGADIDRDILKNEDQIETFFCDQRSESSIQKLKDVLPDFDIIIEDGLHEFSANYTFLINFICKLKKGGIYICEDLDVNTCKKFEPLISDIKKILNLEFIDIVKIPNSSNNWDNNLLVILK